MRDLPRQITSDLLSFDYEDIADEKPIAKGGFGFVYKANYKNTTVVIKKIASESSSDEDLFLKEAKFINSLRHVKIVGFMGLCTLPCAIMLEYVAFDFSRFGHSRLSFLNYMDQIDGFENKSHRHVWGNTLQTDSVFSTLCPHIKWKRRSLFKNHGQVWGNTLQTGCLRVFHFMPP